MIFFQIRLLDLKNDLSTLPYHYRAFYESTPAHWIAIASDYDERQIFWTDAVRKRIMKGGLGDGATATAVFTGTSQTVDGRSHCRGNFWFLLLYFIQICGESYLPCVFFREK